MKIISMFDNHLGEKISQILADNGLWIVNEAELSDGCDADVYILSYSNIDKLINIVSKLADPAATDRIIMIFSQLTLDRLQRVNELVVNRKVSLIACSVVSYNSFIGTTNSLIYYSGHKQTYEKLADIAAVLQGEVYLGENILTAALMTHIANGIHYSSVLALYTGLAMCKKYGFSVETYLKYTDNNVPKLSESAWRNIKKCLDDPRDFHEIDDVIHGMEMLAYLLKKTGGKEEIEFNKERQEKLESGLKQHWRDLMNELDMMR